MNGFKDQILSTVHRGLRRWPLAFEFAKKCFSGTKIHHAVQQSIVNTKQQAVQARLQADRPAPPRATQAAKAGHWDHHVELVESRVLKGWLDWEFIEVEHIRPSVSGDKSIYYLQHFFTHHLSQLPVGRALSLGCGGGNLERALIGLNAAQTIDAFDASPESIRLAKELAAQEGVGERIHYAVCDINAIELPEATYDFIVAKMSLHHFTDLDHIYAQIKRALKPGGVFMFNEYVGPTRFQWTDLQLELANRVLQTLPEKYRFSGFTGQTLSAITRPTIPEMIAMDPSEAVNSAQIMPLLPTYFEVLEHKKYGGTLLHLVMNHIMANFDTDDALQATIVKLIFLYEQTLVENNVLDSDFCYVVARPKA